MRLNAVVFLSADQLAPLRPEKELKHATAHETAGAEFDLAGGDLTTGPTAYRVQNESTVQ